MKFIYGVAIQATDEGGDDVQAATTDRAAADAYAAANEGVYVVEIPFFDGELVTQTQHRVQCWADTDGVKREKGSKSGDHWMHRQYEVFVVETGCSWDLYPHSTWASAWGPDGDECEKRLRSFLDTLPPC